MTRSTANGRLLLILGLPGALIAFSAMVLRSPRFTGSSDFLTDAVALDLLISLPLLYGILIWKTRIPKLTIATAFVVGVIAAQLLIGPHQSDVLRLTLAWGMPALEASVLLFVTLRVRRYIQRAEAQQAEGIDFFDALKATVAATLPRPLAALVATEIGVVYYALNLRGPPPVAENEFSYHTGNGVRTTLTAFGFVIALEVVMMHLLLQLWSAKVAWVATAFSLYAAIQLLAIVRSLPRRPVVLTKQALFLRWGLLGQTRITWDQIETLELSRRSLVFKGPVRQLSSLGALDPHNLVLQVRDEHQLVGFYGIRRGFRTLAFHVDDPDGFVAAVAARREA